MNPRSELHEIYRQLATRYRQRWPGREPPEFPNTTDLNACVAVNQQLVALLNDRKPIQLEVRKEPFLIPLKDEDTKE